MFLNDNMQHDLNFTKKFIYIIELIIMLKSILNINYI